MAELLNRQIKLKEMFEDKMRIALDLEMFGDKQKEDGASIKKRMKENR